MLPQLWMPICPCYCLECGNDGWHSSNPFGLSDDLRKVIQAQRWQNRKLGMTEQNTVPSIPVLHYLLGLFYVRNNLFCSSYYCFEFSYCIQTNLIRIFLFIFKPSYVKYVCMYVLIWKSFLFVKYMPLKLHLTLNCTTDSLSCSSNHICMVKLSEWRESNSNYLAANGFSTEEMTLT